MNLTEAQWATLEALAGAYSEAQDFPYLHNRAIAKVANLDPVVVRQAVRALRVAGMASYRGGLLTEDGDFYGSGHAITPLGLSTLESRRAK